MKTPLWQHQEEALLWLNNRDKAALFMVPRSGKTAVAIHKLRIIYKKHKQVIPTLILTPAGVISNWKREFELHAGEEVIKNVVCLKDDIKKRAKEMFLTTKNIFITNYEALDNHTFVNALQKRGIRILVADEAHRIKNPKGKRAQLLHIISDRVQYCIPLTGSPILNSYEDAWSILRLLGNDIVPENFYTFRNRYFEDKNRYMPKANYFPNWQLKKNKETELKELIAKHAYSVDKSRLKLPPIVKTTYRVPLTPEQEKHYKELLKDFLTTYEAEGKCVTPSVITQKLRLQQICSGVLPLTTEDRVVQIPTNKRQALKEILLETEGKVIIWSHWKDSHVWISELLDELNLRFVSITGSTPQKDRDEIVQAFNNDPKINHYLGNAGAGGIGISLAAAQTMIYVSKTENLEHNMQSEARFEHLNSAFSTLFRIDLVTENTVDEDTEECLAEKGTTAEAVMKFVARARLVLGEDSDLIRSHG